MVNRGTYDRAVAFPINGPYPFHGDVDVDIRWHGPPLCAPSTLPFPTPPTTSNSTTTGLSSLRGCLLSPLPVFSSLSPPYHHIYPGIINQEMQDDDNPHAPPSSPPPPPHKAHHHHQHQHHRHHHDNGDKPMARGGSMPLPTRRPLKAGSFKAERPHQPHLKTMRRSHTHAAISPMDRLKSLGTSFKKQLESYKAPSLGRLASTWDVPAPFPDAGVSIPQVDLDITTSEAKHLCVPGTKWHKLLILTACSVGFGPSFARSILSAVSADIMMDFGMTRQVRVSVRGEWVGGWVGGWESREKEEAQLFLTHMSYGGKAGFLHVYLTHPPNLSTDVRCALGPARHPQHLRFSYWRGHCRSVWRG